MKKHGIILGLSLGLVFASSTNETLASEVESTVVEEQVEAIVEETGGLETVDVSSLPEGTKFINFDSVEEFEQALIESKKTENIQNDLIPEETFAPPTLANTSTISKFNIMAAAATTYNGSARIKWSQYHPLKPVYDAPLWIDFTYTYTKSGTTKKFTKITGVSSHNGGYPATWHQTSKTTNFYDSNKGVTIKVQGYFLFGVNIAGTPIGFKDPDTFTKKWHF
ncbi:hypothetical protein [Bacillus sp. J37]|uniref:hypothetical protein n=1 Tax=Bacillus sp. J37 TaxID=935837 RepID=UPI00047D0411|nr:hypothetical protein [Bacillus sp. J37]